MSKYLGVVIISTPILLSKKYEFYAGMPFGIGVVIGFSVNKGLTRYVGNKAISFFGIESDIDDENEFISI